MAAAAAELLNLGVNAKRAAYAADILGTTDYAVSKFKQLKRMVKRKRTSHRTRRSSSRMRRYKRRSSARRYRINQLGFKVGSGTAKRYLALNVTASEATRTLFTGVMTEIPKNTITNDRIDHRQRDIVNLRGFKVHWQLKNNLNVPLIFNMAVVMDRRQLDGMGAVDSNDVFRGNFETRANNFNTASTATALNSFNLNPERFVILKRKKFILGPGFTGNNPTLSGYSVDVSRSYRTFKFWLPIKRQIRYEDDVAQSPVAMIWWYDEFMAPAMRAPQINAVDLQIYAVTHFKEPKN